jgi:hypothetical protein
MPLWSKLESGRIPQPGELLQIIGQQPTPDTLCLSSRVADPHSFHPDPDPIRIQGFNDQKLKKNYSWKKN